ncbi:MAG TPA: serine protease [Steroidobacteraceae bacterium]|jgi:S1-C subfamily serine protease|nr:serine protease [Steroidobacteraceae bacterium]
MNRKWLWGLLASACINECAGGATPTPDLQQAVRSATFEVVLHKNENDKLTYEKALPLDLIPYVIRSDHYWSVGSAFAIGPSTYVSAAHVLLGAVGSQFGAPSLRDAAGHVFAVDQVLKFSAAEDYIVFTVSGAPDVKPLEIGENHHQDEVVIAAGNALGEGVVIRDGLLTSETPEDQDGRWKWLRFSAAASPGNSGGPLLDESGKVLGIVCAKSPNENLNYALPIELVLTGPKSARFDSRYSIRLPNARSSQVSTLKTQFDLPKSFAAFASAYQNVLVNQTRRDFEQLRASSTAELFPKGDSDKLMASVYKADLPTIVQQSKTDAWDTPEPDDAVNQDLPQHGLVSTGNTLGVTVFHIRRPEAASDERLYGDSAQFVELLLKGLKLTRQVGDQAIRITAMGPASSDGAFTDRFGRRWQVRRWPLGYADSYLVCYTLPTPDGVVGMTQLLPSGLLDIADQYLHVDADNFTMKYEGTLTQWKAFLNRRQLRPTLFEVDSLDFTATQAVSFQSPQFQVTLAKELMGTTNDSILDFAMNFRASGPDLIWDVGGIYLYKDDQRETSLGVVRYLKPGPSAPQDEKQNWAQMLTRAPTYNDVAGHNADYTKFWIRESLSANARDAASIDPNTNVLYDVYYETAARVYPDDMLSTERRLVGATRVLER